LGVGGAEVFAGTDNNEPSCQEIRDSNCPFIWFKEEENCKL